jgi:hypothetical protein
MLAETLQRKAEADPKATEVNDRLQRRATNLYRKACDLGHGQACSALIEAFARGRGTEASPACAARYEVKACELGNVKSCESAASYFSYGTYVPKDLVRAAALYQKACDADALMACESLASLLERGEGVPRDDARAATLFRKVCESIPPHDASALIAGHIRMCIPFADRLAAGKGFPKDEARAAGYYDTACEVGAFDACWRLAQLMVDGRGVAPDPAKAAELIDLVCSNSFGTGCEEGAAMFRKGRKGLPKDLKKARELDAMVLMWVASACDMHGLDCDDVGKGYASPTAPVQDPKTAVSQLDRACALGSVLSCRVLARRILEGKWAPRDASRAAALNARARDLDDPVRAIPMLERECSARGGPDCYVLGTALLRGHDTWKVTRDEKRGRELIFKSCSAGTGLDAECRHAGGLSYEAQQEAGNGTAACDQPVAE